MATSEVQTHINAAITHLMQIETSIPKELCSAKKVNFFAIFTLLGVVTGGTVFGLSLAKVIPLSNSALFTSLVAGSCAFTTISGLLLGLALPHQRNKKTLAVNHWLFRQKAELETNLADLHERCLFTTKDGSRYLKTNEIEALYAPFVVIGKDGKLVPKESLANLTECSDEEMQYTPEEPLADLLSPTQQRLS